MSVPKKKKEEKVIIKPTKQEGNTFPYGDLFVLDNVGNLVAKQTLIIGGVSYPEGLIIEDTNWGKYDLKNNKLVPVIKRKTNGIEIITFQDF